MELPPQLVSAAIQRATADSSGSDNECSNSEPPHQTTTHYASSLLQQFEAQTQLLSSSASITPIVPSTTTCARVSSLEGVGTISDCVLGQINTLPEIPLTSTFLNNSQHLSPQQTEELSQINKDLEEITSESVGIIIPNQPCLDDCVDNNDFMPLDIAHGSSDLGSACDLLKSSPMTVESVDMTPPSQIDSQKLDAISTNSNESQEDVKINILESRRKRGRPRKAKEQFVNQNPLSRNCKSVVNVMNDYHNNDDPPNVSPDSGILSNHNSPTHSPLRRHDLEVPCNRPVKKSPQKENNKERRNARSKSRNRKLQTRSDSSDTEYRKKKSDNEIRHIKSEAPSPVPLKQEQSKSEKSKRNDRKLDIAALDRMLYATDRVLYPPRKKVGRKPQNKSKSAKTPTKSANEKSQSDSAESDDESVQKSMVLSGVYAKRKELYNKLENLPKKSNKNINNTWRDNQSENETVADSPLDPTWKQIDLNPKYKDILSGYKSDHEFKPYKSCSRLIESGYKSDYGCRSGYKSDYSRSGYKSDYSRSGYKSDHRSGYKSDKSGYKTDYSIRSMRRRMRKLKKSRSVRDRTYYKNQRYFVSDQEILVLANKTSTSLNLGHSSSDSDCGTYIQKTSPTPKYVSVTTKYPVATKYNYKFTKMNQKHMLKYNPSDPFAPGPVFSGFHKTVGYNIFKVNHNNNNTLLKSPTKINYIGSPLPASKPVFTHKFGSLPICTVPSLSKKNIDSHNKILSSSSNLSPKNRRALKSCNSVTNKKDSASKQIVNIFQKPKSTYVPNKSISRNIFLNFKKPDSKPSFNVKKHRRPLILAPPKINLKPTEDLSKTPIKIESKHHRHRSKRRHRSRSVSRCRDTYLKTVESTDQKLNQDVESLITSFIKLCYIAPKLTGVSNSTKASNAVKPSVPISVNVSETKTQENVPVKTPKRSSKKRKTADVQETSTPTTKRRHKKQLAESQNKGGKDANEHKLPLKKRHYHINSSTSNSISLSLKSNEFDDSSNNGTSPEKILCTETDCTGENKVSEDSPKNKSLCQDKGKKFGDVTKAIVAPLCSLSVGNMAKNIKGSSNGSINVSIDGTVTSSLNHSPTASNGTDDELAIQKPSAEQSELSKKIYETSEKLKAVHKMVQDLEKSLPKSKDADGKNESSKQEASRTASPKSEIKASPVRNTAPIVTPKKRHRLEAEKVVSNTNVDQVVQSLSNKLLDDNSPSSSAPDSNEKFDDKNESSPSGNESISDNNNVVDPLKTMSARSLYKSSIPPAQKSEIMTRKKNRLEGLTSNLVSKINPSAATKVLDTLLNNNIRKSIESRILEKEKSHIDVSTKQTEERNKVGKESPHMNTRATVIKSPVSKGKYLETKKFKTYEQTSNCPVIINVDHPTGIFEPSIDLEEQIPKSSICTNLGLDRTRNKLKGEKIRLMDPETDLSILTEPPDSIINRSRRSESIASVISDKLSETSGGHNLRQNKRNIVNENDETHDKKKKKGGILRESKLILPPKIMVPKVQAEKLNISDHTKDILIKVNTNENKNDVIKKKPRRRKAINRTGFPSVKKKKKKVEPIQNNVPSDVIMSEDTDNNNSAFERVPKDGEAMDTFLQRTSKKSELKVILNKDECPIQGRLTVVALEKLQGKHISGDNKPIGKKNASTSILRAPALQLKQNKSEKEQKSHVNKWEVLSETDSIPSMASSLSNDPEDSIPLSLLNLKPTRPASRINTLERLKRKTRALSPLREVEDIYSKRKMVEKSTNLALRPKSSLAILCPSERRFTRSSENNETKSTISETSSKVSPERGDKLRNIAARRKSRSCQSSKKIRSAKSSSRDSSLDTLRGYKFQPISRETSVDTILRDHDENDPLPLNEKEIDFEKSIDVLSKTIICKKRVASSRDDSPASSVERHKERDKPLVSKRNPRLRKKFLVAGLFSDYYKEE